MAWSIEGGTFLFVKRAAELSDGAWCQVKMNHAASKAAYIGCPVCVDHFFCLKLEDLEISSLISDTICEARNRMLSGVSAS